jgi:hypothetical protein
MDSNCCLSSEKEKVPDPRPPLTRLLRSRNRRATRNRRPTRNRRKASRRRSSRRN